MHGAQFCGHFCSCGDSWCSLLNLLPCFFCFSGLPYGIHCAVFFLLDRWPPKILFQPFDAICNLCVCVCRVLNSWEYTSKPQAYVKYWPIVGRQSKRTNIVQRKEIECYRYTKGIFKVCHPKKEEKRTIFYKCNRQRFRNHRGLFNGHKNNTNSTGNRSSWP